MENSSMTVTNEIVERLRKAGCTSDDGIMVFAPTSKVVAALSQSHPAPSGQAVAGKHKWAPIMDGTLCCQYCMIDQAASTSDECSKAPRTVTHPAPSGQLVEAVWLGEGAGFKSFTRRKTIAEAWQRDGLKVTPVATLASDYLSPEAVTNDIVERAHKALPLDRQYYVSKDDVRTILGSLPDAPGAAVVKALEWREHSKKSNGCWTADSPFGTYSVVNEGGWWCVLGDGPFGKGFEWCGSDPSKDTLETAKAAAQADYERRIRSALVPTPTPVGQLVKALEWTDHPAGGEQASAAGLGLYRVHPNGDDWYLGPDHMGRGGRTAAQADYELHIRFALVSTPAPVVEALRSIVEFCDDPNGSEQSESLAMGMARLLPAARTALAGGAVGDGWRLVPVEPETRALYDEIRALACENQE